MKNHNLPSFLFIVRSLISRLTRKRTTQLLFSLVLMLLSGISDLFALLSIGPFLFYLEKAPDNYSSSTLSFLKSC